MDLMEQLSAVDGMFLDIEGEHTPMSIGGVSVLAGPAPSFRQIKKQVAGALPHSPRYRQRLQEMPLGLGRPIWVDDPEFDLANHLFEIKLKRGATIEDVCDRYASIMSEHLDRSKPLWQVHICKGLPNGEWAILWTVHHAVVDGIAATDLLALLLSVDPNAKPAKEQEWVPRPAPAARSTAASAASGEIGPLVLARGLRGAAREPTRSLERAAKTVRGLVPVGRAIVESRDDYKSCPINGPVGSARTWRVTELDLGAVKRAAKLHGGTVNDLVLAAVTDGMRENLHAHADSLNGHRIRTMVPVSVRDESVDGMGSNRVSAVFVNLPVDVECPRERLAIIRQQMDQIKATHAEQTAKELGDFARYLPHTLFNFAEHAFMRLVSIPKMFNTVTTNVPGPQFPLYCLGREMRALYPFVMLTPDSRIGTAVFSYNGKIFFGVTGDATGAFDTERVCAGVSSAVDRLSGLHAVPDASALDTLAA